MTRGRPKPTLHQRFTIRETPRRLAVAAAAAKGSGSWWTKYAVGERDGSLEVEAHGRVAVRGTEQT